MASSSTTPSTPIALVRQSDWATWLKGQSPFVQKWLEQCQFKAKAGKHCLIPDAEKGMGGVVAILSDAPSRWDLGALPSTLPTGTPYHLETDGLDAETIERLLLGWNLGSYRFDRYHTGKPKPVAELALPKEINPASVDATTDATFIVRDLINTPAEDMGPDAMEAFAREFAKRHKAGCHITKGDDLLKAGFNTIHIVGRASDEAPRLIDIQWGKQSHPRVTLVGKGVCFDTGGLDIKPSSSMALMKKDMGGAAQVLGLAELIIRHKLPVRLRVLIPTVENNINGNAFRTSDIIRTYSGLTVEVGNTDAEGRLILCDALALADEDAPELLIDCATLTGAARVALGTELPALFANDESHGTTLQKLSMQEEDPIWQLPLWEGYRAELENPIADSSNMGKSSFGGAITAALFLQQFIKQSPLWFHLDLMAYMQRTRPGRPEGGEAMGMRSFFRYIQQQYPRQAG